MWLVGKDTDSTWEFKGVYCSECKAALRTEDENWFIYRVDLNTYILDDTSITSKYYPRKK